MITRRPGKGLAGLARQKTEKGDLRHVAVFRAEKILPLRGGIKPNTEIAAHRIVAFHALHDQRQILFERKVDHRPELRRGKATVLQDPSAKLHIAGAADHAVPGDPFKHLPGRMGFAPAGIDEQAMPLFLRPQEGGAGSPPADVRSGEGCRRDRKREGRALSGHRGRGGAASGDSLLLPFVPFCVSPFTCSRCCRSRPRPVPFRRGFANLKFARDIGGEDDLGNALPPSTIRGAFP